MVLKKETWSFGGQFSLYSSNSESTNTNQTSISKNYGISITPEIGYAIKDNLLLGIGLGYSYYKNENNYTNYYNQSRNSIRLSTFIRKFIPINKKLLFSLKGEVSFSRGKHKNDNSSNDRTDKTLFIGFRPGITYFLSKKISLDANIGSIGYSHFYHKYNSNNDTGKSDYFNLNLNSSDLLFGFTYYIM